MSATRLPGHLLRQQSARDGVFSLVDFIDWDRRLVNLGSPMVRQSERFRDGTNRRPRSSARHTCSVRSGERALNPEARESPSETPLAHRPRNARDDQRSGVQAARGGAARDVGLSDPSTGLARNEQGVRRAFTMGEASAWNTWAQPTCSRPARRQSPPPLCSRCQAPDSPDRSSTCSRSSTSTRSGRPGRA